MDLIKELQCAKANFDSAKEEYRKAQKEILTGLLANCNLLDVDCERKGKLGQLKVVTAGNSYIHDYELRFYPYTKQGTLSQKADGFWLWLDYCKDMDDFVNKLASNGICAVHDTTFDVLKKEKDKDLEQTYENNVKSMVHDILHNAEVRKKYPNLYLEVFEQSQTIVGERFILSEKAFDEWQTYRKEY